MLTKSHACQCMKCGIFKFHLGIIDTRETVVLLLSIKEIQNLLTTSPFDFIHLMPAKWKVMAG
ncbi:MAG: hypothetical protein ACJAS9_001968 [Polaribacter sp.]|jgi:hypothetical protein